MKVGKFEDNVISVEDSQTGCTFHFAVGKTQGFRYIGVQTSPPQASPPPVNSIALAAADAAARDFAQANGWL